VACEEGLPVLADGEPDAALRAAVQATVVLEEDPRFNAGIGSNQRLDGSVELDAGVATSDGRVGGVACLDATRNPILVALEVLASPHVLLCGSGATRFARAHGFPAADLTTDRSRRRLREARRRLQEGATLKTEMHWEGFDYRGTVGAVTRTPDGAYAAACSSGGTAMMLPGRVGDSPLLGCGIMAGEHGAVCATGHGEEIIRRLGALRVYERLARGEDPQDACVAEVAAMPPPWVVGYIAVSALGTGTAATRGTMAAATLGT
jgi:isoaspartyl peptidase/L-asparaginase-like protein (Ntn-hydrolase superfamily)